jgi:putative MATE family efflux protein
MSIHSPTRLERSPLVPLIFSLSLPVMVTLLVQAMYNFVDSIYVSRINEYAFTALSLAFPLQVLVTAVASGTGVGINVLVARALGNKDRDKASSIATHGFILAGINWVVFVVTGSLLIKPYFQILSASYQVEQMGRQYLQIVIFFSLGTFVENIGIRILQATGNMNKPMLYEVIGAVVNIILDPIMIFGLGSFPKLGVTGAAIATVIGQFVSMILVVWSIFRNDNNRLRISFRKFRLSFKTSQYIYWASIPTIIMQSMCTVYITGLNAVAIHFTEAAVSVIGVYYKLQTFLLIPTYGINQGITPLISYCYGANNYQRIWNTLWYSTALSLVSLCFGTLIFWMFTPQLLNIFSATDEAVSIGIPALRIISTSFPFFVFTILNPTLFQSTGHIGKNIAVTIVRQIICLVPLAILLSNFGLTYFWLTFPFSEIIATVLAFVYTHQLYKGSLSPHAEGTRKP